MFVEDKKRPTPTGCKRIAYYIQGLRSKRTARQKHSPLTPSPTGKGEIATLSYSRYSRYRHPLPGVSGVIASSFVFEEGHSQGAKDRFGVYEIKMGV